MNPKAVSHPESPLFLQKSAITNFGYGRESPFAMLKTLNEYFEKNSKGRFCDP